MLTNHATRKIAKIKYIAAVEARLSLENLWGKFRSKAQITVKIFKSSNLFYFLFLKSRNVCK